MAAALKLLNKFYSITIHEGSASIVLIHVYQTLDSQVICSMRPVQVVSLTQDPRCLVPKQAWYPFYRPRRDVRLSAAHDLTHELRGRSIFTIPTRFRSRVLLIGSLESDHSDFQFLGSDDQLYQASRIFDAHILRTFLKKLKICGNINLNYYIHLSNILFSMPTNAKK